MNTASISVCNHYRYQLTRELQKFPSEWCLPWVMLNPSTADATEDDPTIKRIMEFSQRWGYGKIKVVNLFAYRASKPEIMKLAADPVGPENNHYLHQMFTEVGYGDVMVAWGNEADPKRVEEFMHIARCYPNARLLALVNNKNGSPKHPLYVKGDVLRKIWRPQ